LPEHVDSLEPEQVSRDVAMLKEEEETRFTVGQVQLSLVSIFPECPLDQAHHLADCLVSDLPSPIRKEVFAKSSVLFPKSYKDLNPQSLVVSLERYNLTRKFDTFKMRLRAMYPDSTDENVSALFEELHRLVDGDLDLLHTTMRPTLANYTVHEAMGLLKDGEMQIVQPTQPTIDEECLEAINRFRSGHKAQGLEWSEGCEESAMERAEMMMASENQVVEEGEEEAAAIAPPAGETVYIRPGGEIAPAGSLDFDSKQSVALEAIHAWCAESAAYDFEAPGPKDEAANFTQVVWAATRSVGIAVSSNGKYVVAHYDPPGNEEEGFADNVLAKEE
jgi:hypothetical protein